jgi:hypothetical protein
LTEAGFFREAVGFVGVLSTLFPCTQTIVPKLKEPVTEEQ